MLPDYDLEHFTKRVILDALNDGTRQWWLRRAHAFERARPMPHEFHGRQTPKQLRAKWLELTAIADACRARAGVCEPSDAATDLDNVWSEKAA